MLAYIDSYVAGGLVPCKVLLSDSRWKRVLCTASRPGYDKGKVYDMPATCIVPRKEKRTRITIY